MNQLFQWLRFTVWPSRWRWLPGSIAVLVVLGSIEFGILQPSEYMAYNTFIRLRGKQRWHDDIVVIEIDEKTLNGLGQFPLSRDKHAQVLDFLRKAESSIVVFNLVFSEPSPND
ncbi:MAG: CHASE2 domain-containing protein, partial [Merismopedia sp. SIO2A8]|nr:CHASE2 domain-containing protein [Merismopedia sp. SIO2A8]